MGKGKRLKRRRKGEFQPLSEVLTPCLLALFDAEPLTDQVIAELVSKGWPESDLKQMRDEGAAYNRQRNSIVFPPVCEGFEGL